MERREEMRELLKQAKPEDEAVTEQENSKTPSKRSLLAIFATNAFVLGVAAAAVLVMVLQSSNHEKEVLEQQLSATQTELQAERNYIPQDLPPPPPMQNINADYRRRAHEVDQFRF